MGLQSRQSRVMQPLSVAQRAWVSLVGVGFSFSSGCPLSKAIFCPFHSSTPTPAPPAGLRDWREHRHRAWQADPRIPQSTLGQLSQRWPPHGLDTQMIAAHLIEHHHIEGRGRGSLFDETAHVETRAHGAPMYDLMNGAWIAVVRKHHGLVLGEVLKKGRASPCHGDVATAERAS